MTQVLKLYQRLHEFPLGKLAFSIAFALKAPYFRTICPRVQLLEPGKAVVRMAHWWGVNNHIGTVHAIACCNLVEMAMGACAEASIPKHLRYGCRSR
jgi:acyl-coenzyme A thioesterase PaaI-like protein